MYNIKINKKSFLIKSHVSIIEACRFVGIFLPRFCYHEILSVAGNCRMCLVEVEKAPKPVVGCATPITNNVSIYTDSPLVKKARENVLELLLINHPLDCPICDQAGECDLQEQTKKYGNDLSRFLKKKRVVEDKNFGVTLKTIMTRCIHCTRCVRFSDEIAGSFVFGTLNRGNSTEIGSYKTKIFNSEISGTIIDLCPVGALTSKQYSFKSRPWELKTYESIDCTDGLGSNIILSTKETEIVRIQPKLNNFLITDKARYIFDSLNKNRIKKFFIKNKNYESVDIKILEKNIQNIIKNTEVLKNITILINDQLDSNTLLLLNSLKNQVNIRTDSFNFSENYYSNQFLFNKTKTLTSSQYKIKLCFLFGVNLNTECVLLNIKLRMQQNQKNINIFSGGYSYNVLYNVKFVNLNLFLILKLFEGRKQISKQFKTKINSIFIFGQAFKLRTQKLDSIISLIKKYFSKSLIYNINLNCNTESIYIFGNRSINTKILKKTSNIFALNLEDNIIVRKLVKKSLDKEIFWFNSHGSFLALKSKYIVPTNTYFESENFYINLDLYLQKTQVILKVNETFSENLITYLINKLQLKLNFLQKKGLFFNFYYEFNKFNTYFFKILKVNNYKFKFSYYPIKSMVEDFYITNTLSKNSIFLTQRSQENRKNFNKYI